MLTITNSREYDLEIGKNIIICPELYSHNYERFLCEKYTNTISKNTEVITFSRISSKIFQKIGGFANNYINDSGRILAMYKAIDNLSNDLTFYNNNKTEIIEKILGIINEFKMYKVEETELLDTVQHLEGSLKNKVLDLYYIYVEYNKITSDEIKDKTDELDFICNNFTNCNIFDNYNIYFDKFDGFIPQQYEFIKQLLLRKINVTITLDTVSDSDKLFDLKSTANSTKNMLESICNKNNIEYKIVEKLQENNKFSQLAENLFETTEVQIDSEDIKLHISTTIQNECLYTAGKVIDLVKTSEYRYKDILITSRNFIQYKKQLEIAFKRFNIPLNISEIDDISTVAPIKFILKTLDVIFDNYKTETLMSLLKSPMSYIDHKSACRLEDYLYRYDVKFVPCHTDLQGNPSFRLRTLNDAQAEKLQHINDIKNLAIKPILKLENEFKQCQNGNEFISKIYDFCINTNLHNVILNFKHEDQEKEQQFVGIWDIIVSSIDQFCEICGTQKMTTQEFVKLYKTLLSSYSLGSIPSSLDSVNAGKFERIIGEKPKILFVLGADAESLPAKTKENTILTDFDRDILEMYDIKIAPFGNDLVNKEFELIYKVFGLPTDKLFASFSEVTDQINSPSNVFKRVKNIVKNAEITTDFDIDFDFMYKSKSTAKEQYAIEKNIDKIKEIDENFEILSVENEISPKMADILFKNEISPSKIETFNSCQFKFFLQYGLKLDERRIVKFDQLENGNFVHYVLENILKNSDYKTIDLKTKTSDLIEEYTKKFFAKNMQTDSKFNYFLDQINENTHKIVENIISEIKASNFKPCDYELEVDENADVEPLNIGEMSIIGKVDRVDLLNENGKNYLRVIDYKSGVKKMDFTTFSHGLNMQMFIYALAIENSQKYLCNQDKELSAVLYIPTKMPKISTDLPLGLDELDKRKNKELKRSGMIIKDEQIIANMEKNSPFVHLPIKVKSDGEFSKINESLATDEQFYALKKFVKKQLEKTVESIKKGEIKPNPYKFGTKTPCSYCKFGGVCGFTETYKSEKREFESVNQEQFWEKLNVGETDE